MLVLGANLGGAIPPVVASLSGPPSARRVTLANLIVRAAGCFIALPLAGYGAHLLTMLPLAAAKLPVDAHLGFNLALAALAWPFSRLLSRLMIYLVPDVPQSENGPKYLDAQELPSPVIALAALRVGIGDLIERILMRVFEAFEKNDITKSNEIRLLEMRVDSLQQEVKIYLSKLGLEGLTKETAAGRSSSSTTGSTSSISGTSSKKVCSRRSSRKPRSA